MNPSENISTSPAVRPVIASYVVTFLKPEMLHVYRQLTALRAFEPVVFAQKREQADAFPFPKVILLPKPPTHQLRRFWQKQIRGRPITIYRSEARRTLAALHHSGARLLHVYFGHIGIHLLPLLEICDLPVIVSFHGADAQVNLDQPAHRAAMLRVLELATFLLVRSESLATRLRELGCPPEKIRLHRTGIPLDAIPFQIRQVPADGAWRCLQACRLIEKKGLSTTLRAFAQFAQTYPAASLSLAGEGPAQPALEQLALELGIAEKVTFLGFLSQDALRPLMAQSHFFLHPSELAANGDQEGVPNSMLEAMASGLPALATRHGGIIEAVEHSISGLLVAERDHLALAQAMLELAGDESRFQAMSAAAHHRVANQFALAPQVQSLERIYTEALASRA